MPNNKPLQVFDNNPLIKRVNLKIGVDFPDFELPDHNGEPEGLREFFRGSQFVE